VTICTSVFEHEHLSSVIALLFVDIP